ncbi:hypothetical protein [Demequina iriomotensis]|uniref:hypothetical protein n=1 Tax=Demequina iriomotensis TaxID=1536641 RepID=UPI00078132B4|nr:hypothetical protein [Demequina iriomotensis]
MTVTAQRRITPGDLVARGVVAASAILAILGGAWGSGAFGGTPIEEAVDGALASDATLIAPAAPAFAIWGAIYAGLAVFAVAQALPRPGSSSRVRAASLPMLLAMVMSFVWVYTIQHGWLAASVGACAALVACLGWAAAVLVRRPARGLLEAATIDLPVGLFLGWAAVATVANVTALGAWWLGTPADAGMPAALGVLVGTGFLGVAMVRDLSASPALGWVATAGFAWGLAWIGEGRLHGEPADALVGWTALAAAACVVLTTAVATIAAAVARVVRARRARERGVEDYG